MKKPGSEPDGSETLLENVGDVTTLIMTVGIQAMLAISGELRKPKPIIKVIKNQHSKET